MSFDEFKGTATGGTWTRHLGTSGALLRLRGVVRKGRDQTDPDYGVHFGAKLWRSHPADGQILCTRQFRDLQLAITTGSRE